MRQGFHRPSGAAIEDEGAQEGSAHHGFRDAFAVRTHRSTRGYNPWPLRGQCRGAAVLDGERSRDE